MTFALWMIAFIAVIGFTFVGGSKIYNEVSCRRMYSLPLKQAQSLSWPSQQIMKQYTSLPETNRPEPDILNMLIALDTKYGLDKVNRHYMDDQFFKGGSWVRESSWRHNCSLRHCPYPEYRHINDGIIDVKRALVEQEHAIRVAGVESGLNAATELVERLRQEKELIHTITREIS